MRVIGLAGWSGSGKTTLLARLIPRLRERGLSVSTIKHAHHAFDVDKPGKDSHTHRMAGASEVLISSAHRFALMRELRDEAEWTLPQLLAKLSPVDLVLIEGFKFESTPKLEVWRPSVDKALRAPDDPYVRAILTDDPAAVTSDRPVIDLADLDAIADAVMRYAELAGDVIAHCKGAKTP
ncbi:molybdopterin-guanine dinucleotide biosynthesis protein B [Terrarubrum flagellatum]|uniref:molybdopterin-guanine dinucleotide biosynthesis protein B n=1 Tax=Terrirubrum flagellatum TaxID=2895980 RepID=UPI0031456D8D